MVWPRSVLLSRKIISNKRGNYVVTYHTTLSLPILIRLPLILLRDPSLYFYIFLHKRTTQCFLLNISFKRHNFFSWCSSFLASLCCLQLSRYFCCDWDKDHLVLEKKKNVRILIEAEDPLRVDCMRFFLSVCLLIPIIFYLILV